MNKNIDFILSNRHGFSDMLQAKNAYLLLRHEDIATQPRKYAEKIYSFINHSTDPALLNWLDKATSENNDQTLSKSSLFSTTRNARVVTNAWRQSMTLQGSNIIEEVCSPSLKALGYKKFKTIQELRNLSLPSFMQCSNDSYFFNE